MPTITAETVQQFIRGSNLLNERKAQLHCVLRLIMWLLNEQPRGNWKFGQVVASARIPGGTGGDDDRFIQLVWFKRSFSLCIGQEHTRRDLGWGDDPLQLASRFDILPLHAALPAFLTNVFTVFPHLEEEFRWFCEVGKQA